MITPAINSEYSTERRGHPAVIWPGWVDNDARYSVQTDINPIPIIPVRFQNWPGDQFQLSNGWQYTNYGQRMSSADYRGQLYSSSSGPGAPKPMPGEGLQPTVNSFVSQKTLQNMFTNPDPDNSNGAGMLNPGVNLGRRTYYG